jgi:hypothetical protein
MSDQLPEGRQLTEAELADALSVLRQRMPACVVEDIARITDLARLTWAEELEWFRMLDRETMCADPTDWETLGLLSDSNFINGVYYLWALVNQLDPATANRVILEMQRLADERTRTD